MNIPFLDLKAVNQRHREELLEATARVLDSGWYILGKEAEAFEQEFADWVKVEHCLGVSSGLAALKLILEAWIKLGKIQLGDAVAVPANTFIASALAISEAGLKPVLIEPCPQSYNLTKDKLEDATATHSIKVVLVVHLYGRAAPMAEISAFCKERDLLLLEDAAQAHGAMIDGKYVGAWGDAAGFSFYPGKNLGALGDAGAITCHDADLAETLQALRNYGSYKKYEHLYQSGNERLDELQAAFLRVKLKHQHEDNHRRRKIAQRYQDEITNPLVDLPNLPSSPASHVWHLYVVQVDERDHFMEHMTRAGIATMIHYPIPIHRQEAYVNELSHFKLPCTERMQSRVVSLPISPVMKPDEVNRVIEAVNFYKS